MNKINTGIGFKINEIVYLLHEGKIRVVRVKSISSDIFEDEKGLKTKHKIIVTKLLDNEDISVFLSDRTLHRTLDQLCKYLIYRGEIICPNCKQGIMIYKEDSKTYRQCSNDKCRLSENMKDLIEKDEYRIKK